MSSEPAITVNPATNPNGVSEPSRPQWKPALDFYQELRAVRFADATQFAAAAELLWSEKLRDLPYDLTGNRTIIIPLEAVPYFQDLSCTITAVLHPDDLPPDEERTRVVCHLPLNNAAEHQAVDAVFTFLEELRARPLGVKGYNLS